MLVILRGALTNCMKYRLKLECTPEYQARYTEKGFRLESLKVRRPTWEDTGRREQGVYWIMRDRAGREFMWTNPAMLELIG